MARDPDYSDVDREIRSLFFSVPQAAHLLDCSRQWVHTLIAEGKLRSYKVGHFRYVPLMSILDRETEMQRKRWGENGRKMAIDHLNVVLQRMGRNPIPAPGTFEPVLPEMAKPNPDMAVVAEQARAELRRFEAAYPELAGQFDSDPMSAEERAETEAFMKHWGVDY